MTSATQATDTWVKVLPVSELESRKVAVVRPAGKQIALFVTDAGIRACNNRCPHEGFPLSEGSLSGACSLTCNWHNWKFDLDTGANAWGGDRLRVYPVEVRDGDVWLDLADPPLEERLTTVRKNLRDAFDDHDYARIAREIARLVDAGGDPLDALRWSIDWSYEKYEFGWTHAYAGMADWLALHATSTEDAEARMVCLVESVAHAAFDALRESDYPFATDTQSWSAPDFLEAIEREDEATAIALVRGALAAGLGFADLEPAFARAALAHYNAFGHSLIYVTKARVLIEHLGDTVALPLLLSLVRQLVFASREDKIPEFRGIASTVDHWGEDAAATAPDAKTLRGFGINRMLATTAAASAAAPEALFRSLLEVNADNLLHFDETVQRKVDVSVSGNVGWLDFTHALTFGEAVLDQCSRQPSLWPQGLVQLAAFSGRNAAFTDFDQATDSWHEADRQRGFDDLVEHVIDHDLAEYILSVHWLKTTLSVRTLCETSDEGLASTLFAAVNRFVHARTRRRNPRRTAHQSISFVARDR